MISIDNKEIITRKQAKLLGLKRYFNGIPCINGHLKDREVANSTCTECKSIYNVKLNKRNKEIGKKRNTSASVAWRILNKERRIQYGKEYRERTKQARAEYRERTKERRYAYNERWAEDNKERKRLTNAAWLERNKDRKKQTNKIWCDSNPIKRHNGKRNRRAKEKGAAGSHTDIDIKEMLIAQCEKCIYCLRKIAFKPLKGELKVHIDHVVPLAKGGSNNADNLQLLCWKCNMSKGAKDPIDFARQRGLLL